MLDYIVPANGMRFAIIMLTMSIIHGQGGITPC